MYTISKRFFSNKSSLKHLKSLPVNHYSRVALEQPTVKPNYNMISPKIKEQILRTIDENDKLKSSSEKEIFFNKIDSFNYFVHLDSNFDSFFANRPYTIENFNFLLQILSKKKKSNEILSTLLTMENLNITPNIQSYLHLLNCYSSEGDISKSQECFMFIQKKFNTQNIYTYNSLMLAYSYHGKPDECESIIYEMKKNGLEPDIACYTTLIQAYDKSGQFDKCHEIYDNLSKMNKDVDDELKIINGSIKKNEIEIRSKPLIEDDYLMSIMMRICERTHDAEKAILIFKNMEEKGFVPTTFHFNCIISALASRRDYSEKAIEMYTKMKLLKLSPNQETFIMLLKATSHLGDIYTANELIKEIKALSYNIDQFIITGLIKTYASAVKNPLSTKEQISQYLDDTWELAKYAEDNNIEINSYICNGILLTFCNAQKWDEVDNRVIPYFNKHKVKLNVFSYQIIIHMLNEIKNYNAIQNIYEIMNKENIEPTQLILNDLLEMNMRLNNIDGILFSLRRLREMNKNPRGPLLHILIEAKNMPDELYLELKYWNKGFERKFLTPSFKNPDNDRLYKKVKKMNSQRIKEH